MEPSREKFPVASLTLTFRRQDTLSHRDFLGALMALGIERETLGDILVEEGRAVLFLKEEMVSFVEQNLEKVGSTGVGIERGFAEPLARPDGALSCFPARWPRRGWTASSRSFCA